MNLNHAEELDWTPLFFLAENLPEYCKRDKQSGPRPSTRTTLAQIRVIQIVAHYGKTGIMLKDLSKLLELTPGATSRIVDRIVADGLLFRSEFPADRRAILIQLTPKARDMTGRHRNNLQHFMQDFLKNEPPETRKKLHDLLCRMGEQVWQNFCEQAAVSLEN